VGAVEHLAHGRRERAERRTAVTLVRFPGSRGGSARPRTRTPAGAGLAGVAGALSLLATSLYAIAAGAGLLTLVAVLASLYPAVTVLLAVVLLGERPTRAQLAGLGLCAVAVCLVVLG
jgi:drug/metabolite transporter (DMT)-like permease